MASLMDRATAFLDRARARSAPASTTRSGTQQHYTSVKGSFRAGAVTYYAFLSFFPILAVAFFVVGYVSQVFPNAQDNLVTALETILPGLIGEDPDQISLDAVQQAATTVGLIGLVVLVYSGLGWISCMRDALNQVFQEPAALQPSFVLGKLRDLVTLAVIGLILIVSVAISGLVTGFSSGVPRPAGPRSGTRARAGAARGHPRMARPTRCSSSPSSRCWSGPGCRSGRCGSGALLGAIGAGLLKWLSSFLIGFTKDQPAFQAFGIALILLVWINYFSRVVLYAAAWAHTTGGNPTASRARRRTRAGGRPRARAAGARARAGHLVRRRRGVHARPGGAAPPPPAVSRWLRCDGAPGPSLETDLGHRLRGSSSDPRTATSDGQWPLRIAVRRSRLSWEITSSGISLGQAAVHSPMLVQPPKPS